MTHRIATLLVASSLITLATACADGNTDTGDTTGDDTANTDTGAGEDYDFLSCADGVCTVTGTINEDFTFSADTEYLISGGVFVGDGEGTDVTAEIEPGTVLFGDNSQLSFFSVNRGSMIDAEGSADAPIVFTSSKEAGERGANDWGGLIINGRAITNRCPDPEACDRVGEGETGEYGGNEPADNSGVLSYVRVEYAGFRLDEENELNGIAFYTVGSGTQVDHIQVHQNGDDGVEFFGGSVSAKYVYLTGNDDDSLDWTDGWDGNLQYLIVQHYNGAGDQGIEADNRSSDPSLTPISQPVLSNLTIVGGSDQSDHGILLRAGTKGELHNALVMGFNDSAVSIDDKATYDNAWTGTDYSGDLVMANAIVMAAEGAPTFAGGYGDDEEGTPPFTTADWFAQDGLNNTEADPQLEDPFNLTAPNFAPKSGSPALGNGSGATGSFFDATDYTGAVGTDKWYEGWTTADQN